MLEHNKSDRPSRNIYHFNGRASSGPLWSSLMETPETVG